MKKLLSCLAVCLVFASAGFAAYDPVITITGEAQDTVLGYQEGQEYDFSFVVNGSRTEHNIDSFISDRNSWYSETLEQKPVFTELYGSGVSGEYVRPDSENGDPWEKINIESDGIYITLSSDYSDINSETLNGSTISKLNAYPFLLAGLTFDYSDTSYVTPQEYFSDYLGEYSVSEQPVLNMISSGGDTAFDITSVTITPEPATMALLGLGGFILRKRRA
ncbi:hypothetical protein L21SP3_01896 [Sedimentisphaera cyanobacteriorum]|uniref:Ice-binding protein C-terminal domain-containing protein n=1 Tax=Sedimentisphaera cyanobacteriorum TaxID=1940790 RepID=A0A1Q2HRW0_9BACT|nr:PEP-CTERM sorting domain-containing protein [Sedimentisphaera cyanobacteriorum]AQQ10071.1 hypothetical protein L21SP3_01896 [Sedimentisphaera cyanobacteriorum]